MAAVALGAYLLIVIARGNATALYALLQKETGFIKWGVAVALLWYLSTRSEMGNLGTGLLTLAVLGVAMKVTSDPAILGAIERAWNRLPDAKLN